MSDEADWIRFDHAITATGRSQATLNRAIAAGKVSKKLVPVAGRKPEAYLSRSDLENVFRRPVHVPAVVQSGPLNDSRNRADASGLPAIPLRLDALAPILAKLAELYPPKPEVSVIDKLTWSMKEARQVSGLSAPALRELIALKPDLVIRPERGGRARVKAERLRQVLKS